VCCCIKTADLLFFSDCLCLLSPYLPFAEILKQVWDLSDQDSDSMLSLREFCFALYLMERYREGHPLPAALPSNIMYDETLLSMTGQPKVAYGSAAWGPGMDYNFFERSFISYSFLSSG